VLRPRPAFPPGQPPLLIGGLAGRDDRALGLQDLDGLSPLLVGARITQYRIDLGKTRGVRGHARLDGLLLAPIGRRRYGGASPLLLGLAAAFGARDATVSR